MSTKQRYRVAATFRENSPTVYGVYDTSDKSHGFNGRLVSKHETKASAQTDTDALNREARLKSFSLAQKIKEQAMVVAEECGWSCQQDKFRPGKFEGEPWYAPYFFQCAMEGAGDEPFIDGETARGDPIPVDDEEREAFGLDPQTQFVVVWYSEQGFVSVDEMTAREYDRARDAYANASEDSE